MVEERRLRAMPHGPAATRALAEVIAKAKRGDPMRPVSVVMPSGLAAVTVRRRLAVDALVATELLTLPALVSRLAARSLAAARAVPIGALEQRARVRAVLGRHGGRLAQLGHQAATLAPLVDTFRELRSLRAGELAALSAQSPRAAEVVDLFRSYQREIAGRADEHEQLLAAIASVRADDRLLDEIGDVIVHHPRRLGPVELDLLRALSERDRLWAIADVAVAADLESVLGPPFVDPDPAGAPASGAPRVVRAPDPAEEARVAVRLVVEELRAGTPADCIAVVSRVSSPYALLVHEELEGAGIAHRAPGPLRLAQSIAGRVLLGLLEWPANGYRRDELMRLLRAAPIRDPAGGGTHPDRWDRLARGAGVVSGLEQWRTRLEEAKRARLERVTAPLQDATTPTLPFEGSDGHGVAGRLAELDALGSFVERLAAATDPGDRRGWRALSRWAEGVLVRHIGNESLASTWSEPEQRARAAVIEVVRDLGRLEGIGPAPDADEFRRLLAHELDRPAGRVGRLGHGVFVGRLVDAVGADLDAVIVLGAAEGTFPPRPHDDPLLPERERLAAGGALRARGPTFEEEERDIRAVLASATRAVVTFPAADQRNQRAMQPAALVLQMAGERVDVESFEWWLASGRAPASPHDYDVAELVRARAAGVPVGQLPVVGAAQLQRGLLAAGARARGEFTTWSGSVGSFPALADDLVHPRSPTGLQQWATCPFSYFLSRVLGLRDLEDPGDAETITPMDRGTLVHAILERFFRERLGRRHDSKWTAADHLELLAVADDFEAIFRARGLTGRPLLWRAEWAALRRHLGRILEADGRDERLAGVAPVEVELGFGHDGDETPPVQIELGNGRRLNFGGRVDRIDQSPDGRKLVVLDYKTGSARQYGVIDSERADHDIVARGTLLQLPIYALAAQAQYPEAERVEAYYWFVGQRGAIEMKGGAVDAAATARFESVVRTIVDGIEQGLFPARPGADDWRPGIGATHANCVYCEFDGLCSSTRGEQWLQIRTRDELEPYVTLAEGETA
ncbi:MAG TPA: PD-(D/E)XK nuclease family protein [Acidimicrobiales bacterium]|nr:PD-(D/E)XK nuclease family protein [Acidimicrobiales bacterium]